LGKEKKVGVKKRRLGWGKEKKVGVKRRRLR